MTPIVSVLIATYNRPQLLSRAVDSVLKQTFKDFELVIIDDCSNETPCLPPDYRIRYRRWRQNMGAKYGDRYHMQAFLSNFCRGEFFIYLCDDDYWIPNDLLESLVLACTEQHAMVIGGQMSNYVELGKQEFHKGIHPAGSMCSEDFLESFAANPMGCNINTGATLYRTEVFKRSGALSNPHGSKWQCGFEMKIAPGYYGDVTYIDEPCVMVEQRASNASYNYTQVEHYVDSALSMLDGLHQPLDDFMPDRIILIACKLIKNLSDGYLGNAKDIAENGGISLCSKKNVANPVTEEDVRRITDNFMKIIAEWYTVKEMKQRAYDGCL